MSSSVGGMTVAPGIVMILAIVLTRLDDDTTSGAGLGGDRELVDQVDHVLVVDVVGLHEDAERGAEAGLVLERA